MKFIHLTDPHLVAKPQVLLGLDVRQQLADAVASINANHAEAELCMLTGGSNPLGEARSLQRTHRDYG